MRPARAQARTQAALAGVERERDKARALLTELEAVCAAALRRPGYAGLDAARAAAILEAAGQARRALDANANLRITLAVLGAAMTGAALPPV